MLEAQLHSLEQLSGKILTQEEVEKAYEQFNMGVKAFDKEEYRAEDLVNIKLNVDISDVLSILYQN